MRTLVSFASILGVSLSAAGFVACGGDDDASSSTNDGASGGTGGSSGGSGATGGSSAGGSSAGGSSAGGSGGAGGSDGSAGAAGGGSEELSIVEIALADDRFDTLAQAVVDAGLDEALAGEGPFTVFAPTDDAFARLPQGVLESLSEAELSEILLYHVVEGSVAAEAVVELESASTLEGGNVGIRVVGESVVLNGVVQVVVTDIQAENGIIHVIDGVLLPGAFPGSIVDAVAAYPIFDPLVDAVSNADGAVAEALSGDGPLTLFAPVAEAFQGVDTTDDLTDVLLYHALPVEADSSFVVDNFSPAAVTTTAQGADVTIDADALTVNDANIIRVDLFADNGVIHVIDSVLLPPTD